MHCAGSVYLYWLECAEQYSNTAIWHNTKLCSSQIQGGASEWRVHSTLIFENLKPVEKSKSQNNII